MGKPQAPLVPARPPAAADASSFKPRVPWRWLAIGLLSLTTLAAAYLIRERRRVDAMREQILNVHRSVLSEPMRRYTATRAKLEDLILHAGQQRPERWADPRLQLSGLHGGKGLYLRIPADQAKSRDAIAKAASSSPADGIPACLGLAPSGARALWEKGDFLTEQWSDQLRSQTDMMRLRVLDTVLARHIESDLPGLLELLRSEWFLLVLDQPEGTRQGTVDTFLWDLRSQQMLLRGRIQGEGVLLAARIRSKDAPATAAPKPPAPPHADEVARDCSIASQIRGIPQP